MTVALYSSPRLEDQLSRLRGLLSVVQHTYDYEGGDEVNAGAEVALGMALELVDRLRNHLPAEILDASVEAGATDKR